MVFCINFVENHKLRKKSRLPRGKRQSKEEEQ